MKINNNYTILHFACQSENLELVKYHFTQQVWYRFESNFYLFLIKFQTSYKFIVFQISYILMVFVIKIIFETPINIAKGYGFDSIVQFLTKQKIIDIFKVFKFLIHMNRQIYSKKLLKFWIIFSKSLKFFLFKTERSSRRDK